MNTTALVSTAAARNVAKASQRYVYGDFRLVELLGQAQRAGVHRATGRRDRAAHQHLVSPAGPTIGFSSTTSSPESVISTCLIGPVNHFFTDTCQ